MNGCAGRAGAATVVPMSRTDKDPSEAPAARGEASSVLSLRIDAELLQRLQQHAARRKLTVQDYVIRTLAREDFDERIRAATLESARLAEWGPPPERPG